MAEIEKPKEMELNQPFTLGEWLVDPVADRVSKGDQSVKLEPRVMDVLVYLASRPGQIASREELETSVWAGIVVGYEALTSTMLKLRKALDDDPRHPRYIETVSKRGYRLIAEVHPINEIAPQVGANIQTEQYPPESFFIKRGKQLFSAFIIITIIMGALIWFRVPEDVDKHHLDTEPFVSVAVLPFDNISGDPAQQYYANGITNDLITELSRISELTVISKDSTFLLKDDTLDRIRQELGVDYVLKGSVRRDAKQIRINTQLIETHSGRHLWGEHFDATLDDTFSVQDAITEKIAGVLKIHFSTGQDSTVARYFPSIEAYDLFLQGLDFYGRRSFEDLEQAKSYFQQALNLDPNFARAYANLGLIHLRHAIDGWEINTQGEFDKAKSLALQALQLNDQLAEIHFVDAFVNLYQRDYESAIRGLGKALDLRPSYADGYALLAWVLHFSGRPEHAEINLKRAILLNPITPVGYLLVQGEGEFIEGHYADAITTLESALEKNPINPRTQAVLAASYAQANRVDDATWIIDQLLAHHPKVTITRLRNAFPFRDEKQIQQFQEGLRKAGLPE